MTDECSNCRFVKGSYNRLTCHRLAPNPYNALVFHIAELIRGMVWRTYTKEEMAKLSTAPNCWGTIYDEIKIEATEASDYAVWPEVECDDWCGEYQPKKVSCDQENRTE